MDPRIPSEMIMIFVQKAPHPDCLKERTCRIFLCCVCRLKGGGGGLQTLPARSQNGATAFRAGTVYRQVPLNLRCLRSATRVVDEAGRRVNAGNHPRAKMQESFVFHLLYPTKSTSIRAGRL